MCKENWGCSSVYVIIEVEQVEIVQLEDATNCAWNLEIL